jgi:hypothetical protein
MGMKAMATLAGRLLCRAVNQSPCAHAAPNSRFFEFWQGIGNAPPLGNSEFMNYLVSYPRSSLKCEIAILRFAFEYATLAIVSGGFCLWDDRSASCHTFY